MKKAVLRKDSRSIGDRLYDLRKDKEMTLQSAAEKSGISFSTISNYENGKATPNLKNLKKLLKAYGTTLSEFLGYELTEYGKDLETFQRYELSEGFYQELLIHNKFGLYKWSYDMADILNIMTEYPIEAHTLFERLSNFFDYELHKEIGQQINRKAPIVFPDQTTKRMMLEPVIQTLIRLFDFKYSDKLSDAYVGLLKSKSEESQKDREEALNALIPE